MRRGSEKYITLGDGSTDVQSVFSYNFGNNKKLFGSTPDTIYDITTVADPDDSTGLEQVEGLTSGLWIDEQFSATGGDFLIVVNGADEMQLFDGSDWYAINGEDIHTLSYDAETSPFTAGETVTGGSSGASATIIKVIDNGTDGTLILGDVTI